MRGHRGVNVRQLRLPGAPHLFTSPDKAPNEPPTIDNSEALSFTLLQKLLAAVHADGKTKAGITVTLQWSADSKQICFGKRVFRFIQIKALGEGAHGSVDHYQLQEVSCAKGRPIDIAVKAYHMEEGDGSHEDEAIKHERACLNDHPNIMYYAGHHSLGTNNGLLFLKMAPQSLCKFIESKPTAHALLEITEGLLRGLQHLGKQNLLHLDLKMENILVGEHGEAIIADFGCSRTVEQYMSSDSNEFAGTFAILPPETFIIKETPTPKTLKAAQKHDLWALGLIIKKMLGLKLPTPETCAADVSELERHAIYAEWAKNYAGLFAAYPETSCPETDDADLLWLNSLANCLLLPEEHRPTLDEILDHAKNLNTTYDWDLYLTQRTMSRVECTC